MNLLVWLSLDRSALDRISNLVIDSDGLAMVGALSEERVS